MLAFILAILLMGLIFGIVIWVMVKLIERENRQNSLLLNSIIGIIVSGLLFLPLVGILISLLILSWLFNYYELSIGEAIIVLLVVAAAYLLMKWSASQLVAIFH